MREDFPLWPEWGEVPQECRGDADSLTSSPEEGFVRVGGLISGEGEGDLLHNVLDRVLAGDV